MPNDRRPDLLKVLDFGLAKELRDVERESGVDSGAMNIAGTPLYMSPEAIGGTLGVDERSDLYARGAVGYWLLTGFAPFGGTTAIEVWANHLYKEPEPPSYRTSRAIDPELERLVLGCLAKDRERRPRSANALLEALR